MSVSAYTIIQAKLTPLGDIIPRTTVVDPTVQTASDKTKPGLTPAWKPTGGIYTRRDDEKNGASFFISPPPPLGERDEFHLCGIILFLLCACVKAQPNFGVGRHEFETYVWVKTF